jgi:glycosyltransferase involved in cell wall biosynthesis
MVVDIIHLPLLLSIRNRVVYYAQAYDMEYYDNALLRKAIDMLYTIYFRAGKPIISMSQHLTEIFIKRYAFHNTHTIKTGIDHATFYPEPNEELITSKRSNRAIVFMARGDAYRKGHDSALKVFEALDKDAVTGLELWVCGDFVDENRYSFPVRNFGVVTDIRLRQILSSADIFFYPSRHEGFGLFPLEAMACGCVVVTTDAIPYARTTSSILTSNVGDTHDLTRSISRLVMDETVLKNLKTRAMEESKKYDISRSKIAFEFALSEIVKDKKYAQRH